MNVSCRYNRWCFAATFLLHLTVLVWPSAWMTLSLADEPHTVQVFLVQSQARVPAPSLSRTSVKTSRVASPEAVTQPRATEPPAPRLTPDASEIAAQSVTERSEAADRIEVDDNAPSSAAGAPPAVLPRFDPAYLNNQAPPYPPLSRRLGEQGRVLLRVYVQPDGTAREVRVSRSSGWRRLDTAARVAVERWKFMPARQGDAAVGMWVIVPISFSLEG